MSRGLYLGLAVLVVWGDLHDFSYPSEEKIYSPTKPQAAVALIAAMIWMVLHCAFVRTLKLLPAPSSEV